MRSWQRLAWWSVLGGGALIAREVVRRVRALDLTDKTVLITGGSRGLGLVLARQLLDRGARVVICARDEEELARARADLSQRSPQVLALPCDVTDRAQVDRLFEEVRAALGPVDILINNAGVIEVGPVETMAIEDYEEAMAVNFWAPLYTTLAALPEMIQRHAGRIVNIASIGGKISVPHLLPYSASKFALVGLSEGMRSELLRHGVSVTTVCPGLMRTGSPRNAYFKGKHTAEYAWFSISDSSPLTSISAEHAARRIIDALRQGEAELVLSPQAWLAERFHALAPGMTSSLLALVARLLPEAEDGSQQRWTGAESQSAWSPSWLTRLGDQAAERNNEIRPKNGHKGKAN